MSAARKLYPLFFILILASAGAADYVGSTSATVNGDRVLGRTHTTVFSYHVEPEYKPVDTALVIDESGSMGGVIGDAKSAAKNYVDQTRTSDGDENAVVEFSSGASTIQSLTTSKQNAKDAIDSISAGGGTDLPAGVSEGRDALNNGNNEEQVMIVLADGSGGDPGTEADRARSDGIKIHGILYGSGASTSEFESMTNSQCETNSAENSDGDNCWYAESDTINQVYQSIRETTQSETSGDFTAVMPSHAEILNRNVDNTRNNGMQEIRLNNIDVSPGQHSIEVDWRPTNYGSNTMMKTGESVLEFTSDGSTTNHFYSNQIQQAVDYVDLEVFSSYAIRKEGSIELEARVRNTGTAQARETSFRIYDGDGNSIDDTISQLNPGETQTFSRTLSDSNAVYSDVQMIRAKADDDGRWGNDGKELEPDASDNTKKMGYPPKIYGFSPSELVFGDQTRHTVDVGHPEPSVLFGEYSQWAGYNGYEPSDGEPEQLHDRSSYASSGGDMETQEFEVDRAETYWNFTHRINDSYGSMTYVNKSYFVENIPPRLTSHNPANDGFTSEYPVPVSVTAQDPNDDSFTVYIFNNSDNYLMKKQVSSDGSPVRYDWELVEEQGDFEMKVKVEDRWENYTETISFLKVISSGFLVDGSYEYPYSSIIVGVGESEPVFFTARNRRSFAREINMSLSGVNARFSNGKYYKVINLDAYESKEYTINVVPQDASSDYLNITLAHDGISLNRTKSIPVKIREVGNVPEGSTRSVPGITGMQFVVLMLLSVLLYYRRL